MNKQRILIITVGGSDTPVVKSIENHKSDYVCFICSSDSNNIKGSYVMVDKEVPAKQPCLNCKWTPGPRESLVEQTGLAKEDYEIILVNPDNLEDCYLKSLEVIKRIRDRYPNAEIRVDYTGGTKTMSVGLAFAAEGCGCSFSIVKGTRLDLEKVRDGTERVTALRTDRVTIQKQLSLAEEMSKDWDYAGAVKLLEDIANRVPYEDDDKIQYLLVIARGLTAWDRFDYGEAVKLFETYKKESQIKRYYQFLRKIDVILNWYQGNEQCPAGINVFLPAYDCMRNAERCAYQKRYDDAVARLYRTLEMYAQLCLRFAYGIKTNNIEIDLLPQNIQEKYKKKKLVFGKLNLGLYDAYDLLYELGHPVGKIYNSIGNKLLSALSSRNQSFMAHGFTPVKRQAFNLFHELMDHILTEGDKEQGIKEGFKTYPQLPGLQNL